ncbi:PTS glucose transporter subunit IIA [Lederbergia wuyishanensis]|uniref:PTS system glucose-specific IIA component n=1 Tax=Lederbergia wuyishanensis TaxID=1347903 RepID=A0ABU0D0D8_9BACI|nr:PTS glucose transporter subunit IIA [Lederbergia wuyishanensis]MCJ8006496.1 PTS glucose transporter subunit IIA [Lederbergia wuyishanensis]MDQ0341872.1 PTS system glucose-specific IIA component [Lederbergia wuyishanensis]
MFKNLFGKKQSASKTIELKAYASGNILSLEDVPDPVFSKKMMGDGIAIEPHEGKLVSPVDGEIMQVFPTKHAIGIKALNGAEILIHIGLETVSMNGEGFTSHVVEGEKVKAGDTLVTVDLEKVKEKAKSIITPIVITNSDEMANIDHSITTGKVSKNEEVILCVTSK